ncbi:MAG TPA: DUF4159 domain-containing protein [Bryobacteraceae bacterium]|nr:DUF4159 domain-containing protein [Bryobacteraceae bacterium]HUI76768.1 DUF4159 domain-containing protein [Bryobacteraceae bacterium]
MPLGSRFHRAALIVFGGFATLTALYAIQPFREYPGVEYSNFPLPPDYREKTEWVFARLMYPPIGRYMPGIPVGRLPTPGFAFFGDWRQGGSNWTMDYPRSDRHFSAALRRLTRIHVRSAEQPVNLDDHDVYDVPWLYGVEVGHWNLTDAQVATMREFLERGGFFMCDDFHGSIEWEVFVASMQRIFPNRPIVEIPNNDPIFHEIYDLDDRYQVPGAQFLETGQIWEQDGKVPHWRGIYDDHGRVIVAMCFDMDLGDSWEHADNPEYPQKFSALGIRIGVNYVTYAMTH